MCKHRSLIAAGIVMSAWLISVAAASAAPAPPPVDADKLAKEAAEQFVKAVQVEDIESLVKIMDVPFFIHGGIIKDQDELREIFADLFQEKNMTQLNFQIKEVQTYEKIEEEWKKKKDKDGDDIKKLNLGKGDRIVILTVTAPQGREERTLLLVRIREGKVKVVGLRG